MSFPRFPSSIRRSEDIKPDNLVFVSISLLSIWSLCFEGCGFYQRRWLCIFKLRPQLEHAWCAVIFKPWVADQGPSGEPWRTWRTYQISPTYPFQLSDSDWFLNVVKLVEICPTWCWLVAHPGQPCDFRCPKRKAIPLLRPGLSRGHHLLGQWMAVVKPVKGPPQGDVNGFFLDVNGTLTEPWDPGLSKTTCNMEMP